MGYEDFEHTWQVPALQVGQSATMLGGNCYCQACGGDGFCEMSAFSGSEKDDYQGKWLILFFFPAAFSGICDSEVAAFNKLYDELAALNCDVLGVSGDSKFVLKKMVEEQGMTPFRYKLLSDSNHETGTAYGVYNAEAGVNFRGLFIIDPTGTLRYQVVHEPIVGRSTNETLRVLKALQSGQACNINWEG
jgi:alkyl hydroperoxide reductase subunit AhpC